MKCLITALFPPSVIHKKIQITSPLLYVFLKYGQQDSSKAFSSIFDKPNFNIALKHSDSHSFRISWIVFLFLNFLKFSNCFGIFFTFSRSKSLKNQICSWKFYYFVQKLEKLRKYFMLEISWLMGGKMAYFCNLVLLSEANPHLMVFQ